MKVRFEGNDYDEDQLSDYMDNFKTEDYVEEFLDETNPEIEVVGITFNAGHILRNMDEDAFREVVLQEIENAIEEAKYEAEKLDVGDEFHIQYLGEVTLLEDD